MLAETHDKPAIARAFGRAAGSYDRFAVLQQACGDELLSCVAECDGARVLDAGCGTGYFSRRWRARGKEVIALDLSAAMLRHAAQQDAAHQYVQGDIEHLPLRDGCVDICFSNLAVQWCDDLPRAIASFYRVTRPGGVIAFSTLAQGSLHELAQAWRELDGSRRVNAFLPFSGIEEACRPYRHRLRRQQLTCRFPDVLAVMRSLKGIGATWLHHERERTTLTRTRLSALARGYPQRQAQFPLTYQIIYGVIYRD